MNRTEVDEFLTLALSLYPDRAVTESVAIAKLLREANITQSDIDDLLDACIIPGSALDAIGISKEEAEEWRVQGKSKRGLLDRLKVLLG